MPVTLPCPHHRTYLTVLLLAPIVTPGCRVPCSATQRPPARYSHPHR